MCRVMLTAYRHPLIWASWRSAPFSPLRKWNLHLWIWRRLDWARPWATCSKMVLLWAGNQTRWLQRSFSADIARPIWSIERKISGEIIVLSFVTVTQLLNQCLFRPAYRELIALAGSLKADPSRVLYRQQINSLLSAKLGYRPSFDLLCFPVTVRSVFLSSLWSLNQNAYASKVHRLCVKSSHFSFASLCGNDVDSQRLLCIIPTFALIFFSVFHTQQHCIRGLAPTSQAPWSMYDLWGSWNGVNRNAALGNTAASCFP